MQKNTAALGREPIGRLLLKLAAPSVVAQIINLLYNLVDRMYIGRIAGVGRIALTGVGVCLPITMAISAFAALVSMGAAPRLSIFLGRGDQDQAERVVGNSVSALLIISVILTAIFFTFAEPLLLAFGASPDTLPYGLAYLKLYTLGTLFVQTTLGLNPFISAQGFSRISMLTVLIGAVTNIILDPVFIFVFRLGVAGAAWATVLSQFVSSVWILLFLTGGKTTVRIRLRYLPIRSKVLLPCLALGLSPFIMQVTESVVSVGFNTSLYRYGGDLAVGAMTILNSVKQLALLPMTGVTQGAQPIISYNYGAKSAARVKRAFLYQFFTCLLYSSFFWLMVQLFPQMFVRLFNDDPELVAFSTRALRIYLATIAIYGIQTACQQAFVALGNARYSLFLALFRKVVLLLPLIYVMPLFFPSGEARTFGILLAEPVADCIAAATTGLLFFSQFRKVMRELSAPPAAAKPAEP